MRETISLLWAMVNGRLRKEEMQREIEKEYKRSQIQTLPPSIRNAHKLQYLELNSRYMSKYGFYHKVPENHDTRKTI
jgi:hypothetical protein